MWYLNDSLKDKKSIAHREWWENSLCKDPMMAVGGEREKNNFMYLKNYKEKNYV